MQAHTDNIHEIKTDKPLVSLTPLDIPSVRRIAGLHEGKAWTTDDFDDALPEDFLAPAETDTMLMPLTENLTRHSMPDTPFHNQLSGIRVRARRLFHNRKKHTPESGD